MKLPLWVKGRDGKWHRFPYEALTQLPDGRYGMHQFPPKALIKLCEETGWDIHHFFDYSINMDALILKDRAGEEK